MATQLFKWFHFYQDTENIKQDNAVNDSHLVHSANA